MGGAGCEGASGLAGPGGVGRSGECGVDGGVGRCRDWDWDGARRVGWERGDRHGWRGHEILGGAGSCGVEWGVMTAGWVG